MLKILIDKWLDRDTKEADLLVCSDNIKFVAYCSHYVDTDSNEITLLSLYSSDIYLTHEKQNVKKNTDGGFYSYMVVAQVTSTAPPCVKLTCDINIELDCAIPKDIQVGQNIQFKTERLSL